MDVALCCHGNTREKLLRIISEFSMRHPLNCGGLRYYRACGMSFTSSYWSWLVERRFLVKQLNVGSLDEELLNFILVVSNCNPSINKKVINRYTLRTVIENNNMNYILLNHLENISFCNQNSNATKTMMDIDYNSLSLICTNLKSITFVGFNICDSNLSSLLESNSHSLTQLILLSCNDITGINVLSLSLTNLKELKIEDCKKLKEDGWKSMSIGLTNLTHLTILSISVKMLRNTISSFAYLSYLKFNFSLGEGLVDYSGIVFPENLDDLWVYLGDNVINESQFKALFSNDLHNLKQLTVSDGYNFSNNINSAPYLPQSLTSLDMSLISFNFSMAGLKLVTQETIANLILPSSLTHLNLRNSNDMGNIDNNTIITMLSNNNLSKLSQLSIHGNPNIIKDSLSKFLSNISSVYVFW
eukprot:gene7439-10135_t